MNPERKILLPSSRYLGLDLIRLFFFVSIIIFHATWFFWPQEEGPPFPAETFLWEWYLKVARTGAFGGFAILFLSSFLYGARGKFSFIPRSRLLFFVFGWASFSWMLQWRELTEFHWAWDIYPLLLSGFITAPWVLRQGTWIIYFSGGLLSLPLWNWVRLPFPWLQEALIGQCPQDYADWPLLPWIALLWLGARLGMWAKNQDPDKLSHWNPKEKWIWIPVSIGFFSSATTYYQTPGGDAWACYTFRQSPWDFWMHLLFLGFLMRISLLDIAQQKLYGNPISQFLSSLALHRRFYLAYYVHYVAIFLVEVIRKNPASWPYDHWVLNLSIPFVCLVTESICRIVSTQLSTYYRI